MEVRRSRSKIMAALVAGVLACSNEEPAPPTLQVTETEMSLEVGAAGGTLTPPEGSSFAGFKLEIPAEALATTTVVRVRPLHDPIALPELAERVGPQFTIEPADTLLARPAKLTLPI